MLKKLAKVLILSFCILFVIWQCIQCIQKYKEHKKGTEIKIESSILHPYPSITVCASKNHGTKNDQLMINKTRLNDCGIKTVKDYRVKYEWIGKVENKTCKNGTLLYESIVIDDHTKLIKNVEIVNNYENDDENSEKLKPNWDFIDYRYTSKLAVWK